LQSLILCPDSLQIKHLPTRSVLLNSLQFLIKCPFLWHLKHSLWSFLIYLSLEFDLL
jgi:hypothetical protein